MAEAVEDRWERLCLEHGFDARFSHRRLVEVGWRAAVEALAAHYDPKGWQDGVTGKEVAAEIRRFVQGV